MIWPQSASAFSLFLWSSGPRTHCVNIWAPAYSHRAAATRDTRVEWVRRSRNTHHEQLYIDILRAATSLQINAFAAAHYLSSPLLRRLRLINIMRHHFSRPQIAPEINLQGCSAVLMKISCARWREGILPGWSIGPASAHNTRPWAAASNWMRMVNILKSWATENKQNAKIMHFLTQIFFKKIVKSGITSNSFNNTGAAWYF